MTIHSTLFMGKPVTLSKKSIMISITIPKANNSSRRKNNISNQFCCLIMINMIFKSEYRKLCCYIYVHGLIEKEGKKK